MTTGTLITAPNAPVISYVEIQSTGHTVGLRKSVIAERFKHSRASSTSAAASHPLTSRDYQITLNRIRELRSEEDEMDRPSDHAYDRTVVLLRNVANKIGMQFPTAIVATGPSQGIRLLWMRDERELRVTVGGSERNKSYIYWLESGRSGIEHTLTEQTFLQRLNWLVQGN
jgi:hypothetical protein